VISTRALTKRYGAVTAVQSVDLDVREGDRYGLLGPNGSGKTTLVRMLLGLVCAASGQIEVLGQRIRRRRAQRAAGSRAGALMVARDVARVRVAHPAGRVTEGVPDRGSAAVLAHCALDFGTTPS
jgi:ABC-type branched-subunit amino acid transport system ATPase component